MVHVDLRSPMGCESRRVVQPNGSEGPQKISVSVNTLAGEVVGTFSVNPDDQIQELFEKMSKLPGTERCKINCNLIFQDIRCEKSASSSAMGIVDGSELSLYRGPDTELSAWSQATRRVWASPPTAQV